MKKKAKPLFLLMKNFLCIFSNKRKYFIKKQVKYAGFFGLSIPLINGRHSEQIIRSLIKCFFVTLVPEYSKTLQKLQKGWI